MPRLSLGWQAPGMEIWAASRRGLLPWEAWHGVPATSARLSGAILYPSGLAVVWEETSAGLSPLSSLDKQLLSLPAPWGHPPQSHPQRICGWLILLHLLSIARL